MACAGCGNAREPTPRLRARVTRPPRDTVRFEARATASRCGGAARAGLLIEGTERGNGVLVWLRYGDSLAGGEFPLLPRADAVASRGAVVAVRFVVGDVAYGVTLDSGTVAVTTARGLLGVTARGSGLEVVGAARVAVDAAFESVAVGPDAACQVQP